MTRPPLLRAILLSLFAATAATTALAQGEDEEMETPRFRTVPWTVFAGAGTDFDSYSLSLGARRGPWGIGFGYRYNTKEEDRLPTYSADAAPSGAADETSYQLSTVGLDLYTIQPIADVINSYATIGGSAQINTLLVQDTASGAWYRSPNSPDWTKASVEYGAGLEIVPVDWLAIGLGYHSMRGFNLHLGYTW